MNLREFAQQLTQFKQQQEEISFMNYLELVELKNSIQDFLRKGVVKREISHEDESILEGMLEEIDEFKLAADRPDGQKLEAFDQMSLV